MKNLLDLVRGKSANAESVPIETLLASVVSSAVQAEFPTRAAVERRRAEISAAESQLGRGPALDACRVAAAACEDLAGRYRLRDLAVAAQEQAAAAVGAADLELKTAVRNREQREAERDKAAAASTSTADRLALLQTARQNVDKARRDALAEAEQGLNAAIAAGDEAAERAAASAVRQAGDTASYPELIDLDARLAALMKLHEKHQAAADVAESALREAERAEFAARREVDAIAADRAVGAYAAAALSELRIRIAARAAGHEGLAIGVGLTQQVYVHDRRRVWFAPPDPDRRGGTVALGDVLLKVARMLDTPVDIAALKADLRDVADTPAVAA